MKTLSALLGSTLLIAAGTVPARAVDPYVAVQTVAAVISAISGVASGLGTANWEKDAAGKLNQIIQQNDQILSELQELKVFIPETLKSSFNTEIAYRAESLTRHFDLYMVSKSPDTEQIKALKPQIEQLAYNVTLRGPSVYQSAVALTVLELAVVNVVGNTDPAVTSKFRSDMLQDMKRWMGNDAGMFGFRIEEETKAVEADLAKLKAIPQGNVEIYSQRTTFDIGGNPEHPHHGFCNLAMRANVQIDPNSFTSTVTYGGIGGDCNGHGWEQWKIDEVIGQKRNTVAGIVNDLKLHKTKLDELTKHRDSLAQMVTDIENAPLPSPKAELNKRRRT
ncbi:hypothetical protein ABIF64_003824 [Bradyrhizobium japonicum]|uniref:hypothetical protein n=1 Tax=Bradyrhizobium japonicum TaxID=375 RepID=UPI0033963F59